MVNEPTVFEPLKFYCIYIPFNQNLDEKSYMSAKTEAVKHLHAVFLLTMAQCRRPIRLEKAMVYCDVIDVNVTLMLLLEYKLYHVY